jgi:hypothetical protein
VSHPTRHCSKCGYATPVAHDTCDDPGREFCDTCGTYYAWQPADEAEAAGRDAERQLCDDLEVASPFWLRYRVTNVTVEQSNNFGKVNS